MAKNEKLSDIEIYYIENNPDGLTAKELSTKLGRSLNAIKRYLNKTPKEKVEKVVQEEPQVQAPVPQPTAPVGPNAKRAFGHVRKKGHSLATVMTPAASELGDEASKINRKKVNDIPALRNAIHRPYGDNYGE